MEIRPIAYIRTAFEEKFGIPRQSGLAKSLHVDLLSVLPVKSLGQEVGSAVFFYR